jgi:ABC-type transport system involved in cytochrome c biogenesis ATPase subunit
MFEPVRHQTEVRRSQPEKTYGAGKTTTVRILAGLVWPDRGHAGFDAVS